MKLRNYITLGLVLLVSMSYAQTNTPWTTSGPIGIGTTSTNNATFTVRQSAVSQIRLENDALGEEAGIRWRTRNSSGSYIHADMSLYYPSSSPAFLGFKVPHDNTPGNGYQMVVNSDGHVGVGTTAPKNLLHLYSNSASPWIRMEKGSSSFESGIIFQTAGQTDFYFYTDNYSDGAMQIQATGLTGEDDNSPRIRIPKTNKDLYLALSGGNVAIGTALASNKLTVANGEFGLYGIGLDGTTYQRFVLYSDINNGLYFDAPKDSEGNKLPIEFNWRGGGTTPFKILGNGNIGIGTSAPDAKLTVKGEIHAERVKVDLNIPAPDYVFEEDYDLRSLEETAEYIEKNKHLPEIPSAKELEANGVDLVKMNMLLLKKIEELTLHMIEMKKEINNLKDLNE